MHADVMRNALSFPTPRLTYIEEGLYEIVVFDNGNSIADIKKRFAKGIHSKQ